MVLQSICEMSARPTTLPSERLARGAGRTTAHCLPTAFVVDGGAAVVVEAAGEEEMVVVALVRPHGVF